MTDTTSKQQLAERFEFWITTNGYNPARELAGFPKAGQRRIYVNPTVELAWQAVEAMHEPQVETTAPKPCCMQFNTCRERCIPLVDALRQRLASRTAETEGDS